MDIYAWVNDLQRGLMESGSTRVAELIDLLPTAVVESDDAADTYGIELLAAAKAIGNPWLEVYARHWHLRHLVGTRNHGTISLQYAVDSLERAHRPDARECPQSVCATQDISSAYEAVDRYSFAEDREAVSRETLAKVTPRWTCFDCINRELIDAMKNQGRVEEAMLTLLQARNDMEAVGETPSVAYINAEAELNLELGNYERTIELCESGEEESDDEPVTTRTARRINWTTALRKLGRDDVMQHFPTPDVIVTERTLSGMWADELQALVEGEFVANEAVFGRTLETLLQHSERVGSLRTTIDVGYVHACLSADRGVRWVGEEAIGAIERTIPQLRADHGAQEKLSEAKRRVAAIVDAPLPVPAESIAEYVQSSDTSAEQDVELLRRAWAERPNDAGLANFLGMAYGNAGHDRLVLRQFREVSQSAAAANTAFLGLARVLMRTELAAQEVDADIVKASQRLIELAETGSRVIGHRLAADLAFYRDRYEPCIAACRSALLLDADAPVRPTLAKASMLLGDFVTATDQYQLLIDQHQSDERTDFDWDLLTAATAAGRWDLVRAQAARLEIPVPDGDGPIDEPFAYCRVLRPGYNAKMAAWDALRTGPATARIIEVSNPRATEREGLPQYFNEVVVIDLAPINLEDRKEAGDDWLPIFPSVHVLHSSDHVGWILDGASPADEQWAEFRDTLREEGWGVWSATWPGYTITDPDDDEEELPGMYLLIATPPSLSPREVDTRLTEATKSWKHPMAWIDLATAAEVDIQHHRGIIERYDL